MTSEKLIAKLKHFRGTETLKLRHNMIDQVDDDIKALLEEEKSTKSNPNAITIAIMQNDAELVEALINGGCPLPNSYPGDTLIKISELCPPINKITIKNLVLDKIIASSTGRDAAPVNQPLLLALLNSSLLYSNSNLLPKILANADFLSVAKDALLNYRDRLPSTLTVLKDGITNKLQAKHIFKKNTDRDLASIVENLHKEGSESQIKTLLRNSPNTEFCSKDRFLLYRNIDAIFPSNLQLAFIVKNFIDKMWVDIDNSSSAAIPDPKPPLHKQMSAPLGMESFAEISEKSKLSYMDILRCADRAIDDYFRRSHGQDPKLIAERLLLMKEIEKITEGAQAVIPTFSLVDSTRLTPRFKINKAAHLEYKFSNPGSKNIVTAVITRDEWEQENDSNVEWPSNIKEISREQYDYFLAITKVRGHHNIIAQNDHRRASTSEFESIQRYVSYERNIMDALAHPLYTDFSGLDEDTALIAQRMFLSQPNIHTRAEITSNVDGFKKQLLKLLAELPKQADLIPIIKMIAHEAKSNHRFNIILINEKLTDHFNPVMFPAHGAYNTYNSIILTLDGTPEKIMGRLVHEMTHLAEMRIFANDCEPFPNQTEGDQIKKDFESAARESFIKIFQAFRLERFDPDLDYKNMSFLQLTQYIKEHYSYPLNPSKILAANDFRPQIRAEFNSDIKAIDALEDIILSVASYSPAVWYTETVVRYTQLVAEGWNMEDDSLIARIMKPLKEYYQQHTMLDTTRCLELHRPLHLNELAGSFSLHNVTMPPTQTVLRVDTEIANNTPERLVTIASPTPLHSVLHQQVTTVAGALSNLSPQTGDVGKHSHNFADGVSKTETFAKRLENESSLAAKTTDKSTRNKDM